MTELSLQDRIEVSRIIVEILDSWGVPAAQQVVLLGLPEGTRPRAMKRYKENTPLPDDRKVWDRVLQLAGIADALRTSYPRNPEMGRLWMHRRNYRFDDRSPLISMLEDGFNGLVAVHMHLDCSYDWHMDDLNKLRLNHG
jgi:hypothetical protein